MLIGQTQSNHSLRGRKISPQVLAKRKQVRTAKVVYFQKSKPADPSE